MRLLLVANRKTAYKPTEDSTGGRDHNRNLDFRVARATDATLKLTSTIVEFPPRSELARLDKGYRDPDHFSCT